jgi:GWxTD domain-containing protein
MILSCSAYKLEKNLDPESKDFYSKVRYIITKQERKIFLHLPPSDRKNFIEDFWKKRDPDPDTEWNEFKEEYFKRIEEANRLFADGGPSGWLQDRGRIYILLGPPEYREVYPRGKTFYGKPMEIWYYGFFPIVFVDNSWNGNYKLMPLSAHHLSEINRAQMAFKPKVASEEEVDFNFNLKIVKSKKDEVLTQIEISYKNIWFKEEDNQLKTILALSLIVFDSSEKKVWEYQKSYPVSITEEKFEEIIGKDYRMEIPIHLEPGEYSLVVELENRTDGSQASKKVIFTI